MLLFAMSSSRRCTKISFQVSAGYAGLKLTRVKHWLKKLTSVKTENLAQILCTRLFENWPEKKGNNQKILEILNWLNAIHPGSI